MPINFILDSLSNTNYHKSMGVIDTHFEGEDYVIYDSTITDKNLDYICVIGTNGYPSFNIDFPLRNKHTTLPPINEDDSQQIPKILVDKYHDGFKICFVFFTTDESDCPEAPQILADYADYLGIKQKHFYLSTGNSLLEQRKQLYNVDVNVNSNNCIPRVMSGTMDKETSYPFTKEREKLFQCYNNMAKQWRFAIYTFFNKENLLDKVDLSLLGHKNLLKERPEFFRNVLDTRVWDEWFKIGMNSIQNKICLKSKFENFEFMNNGPQHSLTYQHNLYKHAYINVVTETQFYWEGVEHITEKSIQPFFFYQIPIIIATPNHIKNMKEKWGLDFFDDIVNHSYDSIEDSVLRFHKITKEILRLSKMENEIRKFVIDNQDRFEKNKEIIRQIRYSKSDEDFWKNIKYIK